jgi:hypothetical protein
MSQFDDYLDECYPPYNIMGMEIPASRILKECDPIAYQIAESEFEDMQEEGEGEEDDAV